MMIMLLLESSYSTEKDVSSSKAWTSLPSFCDIILSGNSRVVCDRGTDIHRQR